MKIGLVVLSLSVIVAVSVYMYRELWCKNMQLVAPTSQGRSIDSQTESEMLELGRIQPTIVVAQDLSIPWDVAFLPEGELLITERTGNIVYLLRDGARRLISIPEISSRGEGGLLGIVLHPQFETNQLLYVYKTVTSSAQGTTNAVVRYRFDSGSLTDAVTILSGIPGAIYHDGGRLEFGPDSKLYIVTGDAVSPRDAQDLTSLSGKILRLNDDGSIPSDNPFGTAVYSYGHRNPQGITWDDDGRLWSTEHGRSGVVSGLDELNLIEMGKNYGWPTIEGDDSALGMERPAAHSGSRTTWAPASALFWDGSIFFGGLRGEALYEAVLSGSSVLEIKEHLKAEYGRLRTVRLGPDGMFYLTTSNTDGRGTAHTNDDRVIRIDPQTFR